MTPKEGIKDREEAQEKAKENVKPVKKSKESKKE